MHELIVTGGRLMLVLYSFFVRYHDHTWSDTSVIYIPTISRVNCRYGYKCLVMLIYTRERATKLLKYIKLKAFDFSRFHINGGYTYL
jgi:hypothetical protein